MSIFLIGFFERRLQCFKWVYHAHISKYPQVFLIGLPKVFAAAASQSPLTMLFLPPHNSLRTVLHFLFLVNLPSNPLPFCQPLRQSWSLTFNSSTALDDSSPKYQISVGVLWYSVCTMHASSPKNLWLDYELSRASTLPEQIHPCLCVYIQVANMNRISKI